MGKIVEPIDLDEQLANPKHYEEAILRIYTKRGERGLGFTEADRGVSYFDTAIGHRKLSKAIALEVAAGNYRPCSVQLWFLDRGGRRRAAHEAIFTDQVVGSVMFRLLMHNAQYIGLPGVYSYLPGTSNVGAMRAFADYVRTHRSGQDHSVPPLYVLQSDFERYGDDLPVGPGAPIWEVVRKVATAGSSSGVLSVSTWKLVVNLIRPTVLAADGTTFTRVNGVAMGTPLVPLVGNLAVLPLDAMINSISGAFYARYNDDFIVAHPDLAVLREVDSRIDPLLGELGVKRKLSKDLRTVLSGNGQTSVVDSRYRGRDRIDALGLTVGFTGTISLGSHRQRRFVEDVARRIDAAAVALSSLSDWERAHRLVGAVNAMLDIDSPFAVSGLPALLGTTTDRGALKDLDFRIARKVVQIATRTAGNRGFRRIPPLVLRRDMNLVSLVQLRNLR
ncbi:hypothetical protein LQL77_31345 [Rhodococcus cerastii]|nr:hypothetical protein [Rhodococcus cerastii]